MKPRYSCQKTKFHGHLAKWRPCFSNPFNDESSGRPTRLGTYLMYARVVKTPWWRSQPVSVACRLRNDVP